MGLLQLPGLGAALSRGAQLSHCSGFSRCGAQVPGTQASAVEAPGLQSMGSRTSVAPCYVESSQTRDQTCDPALAGDSYPLHQWGSPSGCLSFLSFEHSSLSNSYIFLPLPGSSPFIQRTVFSFSREWYMEIKTWALEVLLLPDVVLLLGPLREQLR